jgi:hypothetical protein
MKTLILTVAIVLAGLAGRADAYPQFQLVHDQTCSGCHISPAGGNLLNENGLAQAESMSQLGHNPEFFYGKPGLPKWLTLGGDLRGAAGLLQRPGTLRVAPDTGRDTERSPVGFPMQAELYAALTFGSISVHVTAGGRPPTQGNTATTLFGSREHYLMWKSKPGENTGVFIRAGRFMPVIGLRLAEHPTYIRRYGGTQLYADTYGAAIEYVTAKAEAHLTGFIEDPVLDPVSHANGAAGYGELRLGEHAAVGAEGMYEQTSDDKKFRVGMTGKVYLPGPDLLFQTEIQFMNQLVDKTPTNPIGGAPKAIISYLLISKMLGNAFLLDLGFGFYDENVRIKNLDRDCVDLNLHWFTTSHLELILNTRYELIGYDGDGKRGSDPGAYALLQLHYRL